MTSPLVTMVPGAGIGPAVAATLSVGRGAVAALAGVVGLLVGSFLNVVVYRVPRALSVVHPRSFCPRCETPVRSTDNIPVLSWALLRGRCRHCAAPISPRYPLVELVTGVSFAVVGLALGAHWSVAGACVVAATLVALVSIEYDGFALPLTVALVGAALAVVALVAAAAADHHWARLVGVGVGSALGVLGALGVGRRRSVPSSLSAGAPVWLPAGAWFGWLGPGDGAIGVAVAAVVLALLSGPRRRHDKGAMALSVGTAVVVATVVALATGRGPGT